MKKLIAFSLFALSLCCLQAYDQPTRTQGNAAFTLSANPICAGDSVIFTPTDLNQLGYIWKINGLVYSTNQVAGIRLFVDTTYTITLLAADIAGLDSTSQTLQVIDPPQVGVSTFIEENCVGSRDGELGITITAGVGPFDILWSTGAQTPNISNLSGGTYIFQVTDTAGCALRDTVQLATLGGINAGINPNTAVAGRACKGDSVFFANGSALINSMTSFTWFQDGQIVSQDTNYGFTFLDTGTFQIMLAGEVSTCLDTARISIRITDPEASFSSTADIQACPGEAVQFTNNSVRATNYQWFVGNMLFSTQQNPNHIFSQTGNLPITLVIDDGACSDTVSESINIFAPMAAFTADTLGPICQNESINFTNASTGALSYQWTNNGTPFSTQPNVNSPFPFAGNFDISLIASDGTCEDTATVQVTINEPPNLNPQVTDESCDGSMNGEIDLGISGAGPFASTWQHGPTTPIISGLVAGKYVVDVLDANGCSTQDSFDIRVLGGLVANFSSTLNSPGAYQFSDQSSPTPVTWLWQFGDGNVSPMQNPTHTYAISGSYEVCLISTDQFGCKDTSCATLSVSVGLGDDLSQKLSIYPNPTSDVLVLEANEAIFNAEITLYNPVGKQIFAQKWNNGFQQKLNLSNLPSGVYQIILRENGKYWVGKVMKK